MGGRGTSSATASSGGASLKQRFRAIAESNAAGRSANSRDYAAIAEAAAGLVGTKKLQGLLGDRNVTVLARELGGSGGSGNLHRLNNLRDGVNQPLGMSDAKWKGLGSRLTKLNDAGYSNEEIAAVIRFEKVLRG